MDIKKYCETLKYLKKSQIRYLIKNRLTRGKAAVTEAKAPVKGELALWMPRLDEHPDYLKRFSLEELLDGKENVFLIPYRTVSGSGEMLRGIVFDRMIVSKGRKTEIYEHPVIALTGERVSSDGSYQMILHPDNRKNQEEKDYV